MIARKSDWRKAYEASMQLSQYLSRGTPEPSVIESLWRRVFGSVLKDFGLPSKARRFLWDNLVVGNWKHLHMTETEKTYGTDDWLDMLSGEVFYCSDRWTMDRLTRCHWMYRQYMDAAKEEE